MLAVVLFGLGIESAYRADYRRGSKQVRPGYDPFAHRRLKTSEIVVLLSRRVDVKRTYGVNSPPVMIDNEIIGR